MNSEQVSLESLAEDVERLCSPDIGRELGAKTEKTIKQNKAKFLWKQSVTDSFPGSFSTL